VHLRARDYVPEVGRFTSPDPLPGVAGAVTAGNPYPYADNDPLNMIDPLGLRPLTASLLDGVAGYLTVDHAGEGSPYEEWQGVSIQTVDVTRTVRGPAWGTLLGPRHRAAVDVAAVSAVDSVTVEELGDALWVWLPGDVDDPDVDVLRQRRDLLHPVLPKGMDDWTYYVPLRIAALG
jgi:hypothetical protein